MRIFSTLELLEAWERGIGQTPAQRALVLLAATYPEASMESLGRLSVGERDAMLLMLREALFGSQMAAILDCRNCGRRLELDFNAAEVVSNPAKNPEQTISAEIAGYQVSIRPPTSADVIAAAEEPDANQSKDIILRRCLTSIQRGDQAVNVDELPGEVMEALVREISQADPLAEIQMAVCCPVCEHSWRAGFDIASFLWNEIDAWVRRILNEVHTLASAYGWREREILELSPVRRQFYLDAVGA